MREVAVIGAGMIRFGKWLGRIVKSLNQEAVNVNRLEAAVDKSQIEAAMVGNATAGLILITAIHSTAAKMRATEPAVA